MKADELIKLRDKITQAKSKASELVGRKNELMKRIKKQYGCTTLSQLKEKIESMETDLSDIDDKIEIKTTELKEEHGEWLNSIN